MAPKAGAKKPPESKKVATPQPKEEEETNDDYDMPIITKVTPEDQLDLTPEELEKEVPPRVLYPSNPRAPQNITQFSFKDRVFKRDDEVRACVVACLGCLAAGHLLPPLFPLERCVGW